MAGKINSYKEFQDFMDACCAKVGADPDSSGHGRWWIEMKYDEFMTTGTVKHKRIVAVGDADNSIMIRALRGIPPDFAEDSATGFGRMPKNAMSFFDPADVEEIADWVGRGCPNPPPAAPAS